jgi:hypothetical protein
MFSSGAIAVLPRLTGNFLKIINPTLFMASKGDTHLAQHYSVPRSFIELITTSKQKATEGTWQVLNFPNEDCIVVLNDLTVMTFEIAL